MLLFAVLSIIMLLVVDLVSYALGRRGWLRFVCTFLLFYVQVIATEFLLGLFTLITGPNLVALNALVSGLIMLVVFRKFGKRALSKYASSFRPSFSRVGEVLREPAFLILLVLAIAFGAWIIYLGVLFPSLDFDGNSYHLTFTAYAIQNHTFFDPTTSLPWLIGYPKGGEFTQLWSAIILHRDTLTDLAQIPFVVLGIGALYRMAVAVGASKRNARFSALLFCFLPIVLNQLKTTYVDVMLTSIFFASIALIIQEELGSLDLLLIGTTFSLLLAIKSTGLLFVLVLLPLLLWKLYSRQKGAARRKLASYLKPIGLVAAPMWFGVYWYVKNYVLYGTPIYPFGFKILGFSIFPGRTVEQFANSALSATSLPPGFFEKIWYVWTEQKLWYGCLYNYDTNYAGLGPIWFIILLPAIILATYLAIKRRNYLFLAITALVLVLFLAYPDDFYARYTMFIAGVGVAALAIMLSNVHKVIAGAIKVVAILLALVVIFTNLVLCDYGPKAVMQQVSDVQAGDTRGTAYVQFTGQAYAFLQTKIKPGDVVAYDSKPFFIYPLWKPDFSNTVLYIPAGNANSWYQQLKLRRVTYVFTTYRSKENKWAKSRLHSIYKDDMYEIFQVN